MVFCEVVVRKLNYLMKMEGTRILFAPSDTVKAGSFLCPVEMISLSKFGILILGVVFILCKQF